ncbi:MAG: hypothetical protein RLP44_12150 [Aggregatilineales bacterium]
MATELIEAPELEAVHDGPVPNPRTGQTSLTLSLALIAGFGLTVMIIALAWGVVDGNANGDIIGVLLVAGGMTLVSGIAGWAGLTRPWEHFDNINEAQYHGHEEHHDDDAHITDAH